MTLIKIFKSILFSFLIVITLGCCNKYFFGSFIDNSKSYFICESTVDTERVNIDGLWWIIIYEDGVKIDQYLDPDQT